MAAVKVEPKIFTAIVLDFETGGLDPKDCAITQIAMQAVRIDTWELLGEYQAYVYPYNFKECGNKRVLKTKNQLTVEFPMKYEDKALEYTNITMDMLRAKGVLLDKVAADVLDFIKVNTLSKGAQCKPILIGQNITFDIGFLQQLMVYSGLEKEFAKVMGGVIDFYGHFQPFYIDTLNLGRMAFAGDKEVTSYKLELLVERFGVELVDAHDAMADVLATLNVAAVCAKRLSLGSSGDDDMVVKKDKTRLHFKI